MDSMKMHNIDTIVNTIEVPCWVDPVTGKGVAGYSILLVTASSLWGAIDTFRGQLGEKLLQMSLGEMDWYLERLKCNQ